MKIHTTVTTAVHTKVHTKIGRRQSLGMIYFNCHTKALSIERSYDNGKPQR